MTTAEKNAGDVRAVPETELANVVLHAGELSDINYLRDYIQVIQQCIVHDYIFGPGAVEFCRRTALNLCRIEVVD